MAEFRSMHVEVS